MKTLTKIGIGFSVLWVGLFLGLSLVIGDPEAQMGLNGWGDFLAGVSAPLALFWLVIGYFQQGEELRLNTKALAAQQEELRRQVEETALLAENSGRQAVAAEMLMEFNMSEADKEIRREYLEAQPKFIATGGSSGATRIQTAIVNDGGTVTDVRLEHSGQDTVELSPGRKWDSGQKGKLDIVRSSRATAFDSPFGFSISYVDKFGTRHIKKFIYREAHKIQEMPGGVVVSAEAKA